MLSNLKICIPVVGLTLESFLLQLKKAQNITDFIELRVDFIKKINTEMLNIIARHTYKKSILCCRAERDGGNFKGTLEEQNKILQIGNNLGFNYLEIDLNLANKITIQNKKANFILSYHNFKKTPDFKELTTIAAYMRKFNPHVIKFAVMANNDTDVKTLFQLLLTKKENENMIVLGMGQEGKITRLLTPLLGGYLTFASLDVKSAPGQINYDTMKSFYYMFQDFLDH